MKIILLIMLDMYAMQRVYVHMSNDLNSFTVYSQNFGIFDDDSPVPISKKSDGLSLLIFLRLLLTGSL